MFLCLYCHFHLPVLHETTAKTQSFGGIEEPVWSKTEGAFSWVSPMYCLCKYHYYLITESEDVTSEEIILDLFIFGILFPRRARSCNYKQLRSPWWSKQNQFPVFTTRGSRPRLNLKRYFFQIFFQFWKVHNLLWWISELNWIKMRVRARI